MSALNRLWAKRPIKHPTGFVTGILMTALGVVTFIWHDSQSFVFACSAITIIAGIELLVKRA